MPTHDRRAFVARAVEYFMRQDYEPKELIIVDDGSDAVADLVPDDGRVRYVRLERRMSVGAKRNTACEHARGEVIAHWDDDDWHAPRRLSYQVEALLREGAEVCGIRRLLFFEPSSGRAWLYTYPESQRPWLSGSTLCYTRAFWERTRFADVSVGEDARFLWAGRPERIAVLDDNTFHVGIVHEENVSPKQTGGSYWKEVPSDGVRRLLGDDWGFYVPGPDGGAPSPGEGAPRALVTAAYGIGDILRVTPLVRALALTGYSVDVLIAPDYPGVASLLEGAPEIQRLFVYEGIRANRGLAPPPPGFDGG
ncbi:MAG TPA: glycosyltransferase, partial [Pyrinomonadaceae bacterium]|nr:glycosyltransferase [Pyrinomonadaceae bacterium]